jgi:hypothetical protein
MKNLPYIFLLLTLLSSCDEKKVSTKETDDVLTDTLIVDSDVIYKEPQPISCNCEEDTNSVITKIPIQLSSIPANFKLIEEGKVPISYKLPEIKEFTYIPLDFYETHYLNDNSEIEDFKESSINNIFSKYCCYKVRLPDINNYQTYLVYDEDNEYFDWSLRSDTYDRLGFLFFYNASIEHALVFTIEFNGGGGEGSYLPYERVTSIDKKFNVTIQDYRINIDWDNYVENGNPVDEIYKGAKYLISVLPTGNIKVTYPMWTMTIYDPKNGDRHEIIPAKEIIYASDGSVVSEKIIKK